jgi:hypothetical protein
MDEKHEMSGCLTLRVSNREGRTVYEQSTRNRIVASGRTLVAHMFGGPPSGPEPTRVTHMAVGTDGTPPTDGNTQLGAQREAKAGVPRKPIGEVSYEPFDDGGIRRVRARLTAEFDFDEANGDEPLREAGVFNDGEEGVMYNRVVFEPVTKTEAFKLTLLWDIVF